MEPDLTPCEINMEIIDFTGKGNFIGKGNSSFSLVLLFLVMTESHWILAELRYNVQYLQEVH